MTLLELQDVLAERIRIATTPMSDEERKKENVQSNTVIGLAKQFVNASDCIIRAEKLSAELVKTHASVLCDMIGNEKTS